MGVWVVNGRPLIAGRGKLCGYESDKGRHLIAWRGKHRGDRWQERERGAVGGGYKVPAPNGGARPNGGNP